MRILAATDGSDAASRAVDLAARLAKALNGHLNIIHVISGHDVPAEQLNEYALQEHMTSGEVLSVFSQEKLKTARQRAEALGVSDVRLESEIGDVAEAIIEAARRDEVDMIVLGKRGLGRLSGLLLGSVSQKLVSVAPCAVIVVP